MMLNASNRWPQRLLSAVMVLIFIGSVIGTAGASLQVVKPDPTKAVTFFGHGGYSADALGQNGVGGSVEAEVPAGSTVFLARLYGTYVGPNHGLGGSPCTKGNLSEEERTINFDGTAVVLAEMTQNEHDCIGTAVADVSSQVAAKVAAGPGTRYPFQIRNDPTRLDGVGLVVIYSNPASPEVSIAILEGGLSSAGQTTTLNFANPVNKSQGFIARMSLGIGYGYQGATSYGQAGTHQCGAVDQRSIVIANPNTGTEGRLTSCAGNYDDGVANNGGLITLGGLDDSFANPTDPNSTTSPSGDDDELYNIAPFIADGSTSFSIKNENASGDDNIFLAILEVTGNLAVSVGPKLTVNRSSIPASPAYMGIGEVPLQPNSPSMRTSPLNTGTITISPLNTGTITISPLNTGTITISPLNTGTITISPLNTGTITISPLDTGTITKSPLTAQALASLPLSKLPLNSDKFPGGWQWAFEGSSLAGVPDVAISLLDAVSLRPRPERFGQISYADIDWSLSPLGSISQLSIAMGQVPLSAYVLPSSGPTFCSMLESQAFPDCGSGLGGLDASLFAVELAGGSIDEFPLAGLTLGNIDLSRAAFPELTLKSIDDALGAASSPFFSVRVGDIPNKSAVVTCSPACDSQTLFQAKASLVPTAKIRDLGSTTNGRWRPIAAVEALSLGEAINSLLPRAETPFESMPMDKIVNGYTGPGASVLDYSFSYTYQGSGAVQNPAVTVTLPETFQYVAGSSQLTAATGLPMPIGDPQVNGSVLTWTLARTLNSGDAIKIDFKATPGLRLGTFTSDASISGPGLAESTPNQAPVTVQENFEANEGSERMAHDVLYFPHHGTPGDIDTFRYYPPSDTNGVPIAGNKVRFNLSHLSNDADLVVYLPNSSVSEALRSSPLNTGTITISPLNTGTITISPVGDQGLDLNNTDTSVEPQTLGDIPLRDDLVVAGSSANRALTNESVEVTIPAGLPSRSYLTVQTSAYNGSSSNDAHLLRASVDGTMPIPACQPRSFKFPNAGGPVTESLPSSIAPTTKTVFLADWRRLAKSYGDAEVASLKAAVATLAGRPEVTGQVIPLDGSLSVQGKLADWDAEPCSAFKANEVVRATISQMDALLKTGQPPLEYIVVVGGDEIIPMARLRDRTVIGNESAFADDLGFTTTSTASTTPRSNALIGSLASQHLLSDDPYGDFNPSAWSGDFLYLPDVSVGRLVESAGEIKGQVDRYIAAGGELDPKTAITAGYDFNKDMATNIDALQDSRLGSANAADLISESWTRSSLKTAFTNKADVPELVFPQGHANQSEFLPASGNTAADTSDNFSTADVDSGNPLGGAIIASISCHFGLNVSDVLLGASSSGLTTGQMAAYRDWAQSVGAKGAGALAANTGYGYGDKYVVAYAERLVSHFAENLTAGVTAGNAFRLAKHAYWGNSNVADDFDKKTLEQFVFYGLPFLKLKGTAPATTAPAAPATTTDSTFGTNLQTASLSVDNTFTQKSTPDGSYLQIGSRLPEVTLYRPITGGTGVNITKPGFLATGAVLTSLTQLPDIGGFDPVISVPVDDSGKFAPEPQFGDLAFPSSLQGINNYLAADGPRQQLNLLGSRFQSTGFSSSGKTIGVATRFSKMNSQVFYAPLGTVDNSNLRIVSVESSVSGGRAYYVVKTADNTPINPDDTAGAMALVKDGLQWKQLLLTKSGPDPDVFTGNIAVSGSGGGAAIIQVWTDKGFVRTSTKKESYYGDAVAPTINITTPANGAVYLLNQPVTAAYSCSDSGSGVHSCGAADEVPNGGTVDTSTPGTRTFRVTASDKAGNVVVLEHTYRVVFSWTGFLAPIKNTDNPSAEMNAVKGGQAIPFKWKIQDFTGAYVDTLTMNDISLVWSGLSCSDRSETPLDVGLLTLSIGLKYDPVSGQYLLVVDTPKTEWANKCRRATLTLPDGSSHFADFAFK